MSKQIDSFIPSRKWAVASRVLLSIIAVGCLVLLFNHLATRHVVRFQLSKENRFELSPLTHQVLNSLTNEIQVIVFFDREQPLYSSVEGLLNEYKYTYPKLSLKTVDYYSDTAEAQLIKANYNLNTGDRDLVIFSSSGKHKVVYSSELSDYDYDLAGMMSGENKEIKRAGFKGERLFTSAILSVADKGQPTVYFLQGHGEHDPRSDEEQMGYSNFARLLVEKNIRVQLLDLRDNPQIPGDCDLLIIAGPRNRFLESELDSIEQYLMNGGRLLSLFNYHTFHVSRKTGLEELLTRWGVELGQNVVFDPQTTSSSDDLNIILNDFASHPIVKPLYQSRIQMFMPRSVRKSRSTSQPANLEVEELAMTSKSGGTKSAVSPEGVAQFDVARDVRGAIPVMAAIEKGGIQGLSADGGSTRIVVVGESIFLSNTPIKLLSGNRDFAAIAVNWLLDRNVLMAIGPKPVEEYQLTLSNKQLTNLRWLLLAGMPGSVLLMGVIVWLQRRN